MPQRRVPFPAMLAEDAHPPHPGLVHRQEPRAAFLRRQGRIKLPPHLAFAVHIHHADDDLRRPPRFAEHMAVADRLHFVGLKGHHRRILVLPELDFLDDGHVAVAEGVHAATQVQFGLLIHGNGQAQGNFRRPAFAQEALARLVAQHALLHVRHAAHGPDVRAVEGELHQRTHGDADRFHGRTSLQGLRPIFISKKAERHTPSRQQNYISSVASRASLAAESIWAN